MTRSIRTILKRFRPDTGPGISKAADVYNWDNCNPSNNGEYFFIEKNAEYWDICLDVGANSGKYASKILKHNPACRVICFEPNDELNNDMKSKGIKEIHNYVVGDIPGMARININTIDSTQSSIYRKAAESRAVKVKSITIDEFLRDHHISNVSLLKIDTEGHEAAVLKGAMKALSNRKIDFVQFEYGGTFVDAGTTLEEIYKLLGSNYLICHVFPQGLFPVKYSKKIETFRYSNWVALSRELFR